MTMTTVATGSTAATNRLGGFRENSVHTEKTLQPTYFLRTVLSKQ